MDIHAGTRVNPKYHSLLGRNQHPQRTEKTIRMSSGSAAINIYKNVQTQGILGEICRSDFNREQQRQIQECLRSFNIELQHLAPLRIQFIKCDRHRQGRIKAKDLVKRFAKIRQQYPMRIFNFLINTLAEKDPDMDFKASAEVNFDPEAILSFEKLQSLFQIYNRCPASTKGYTNNSSNFRTLVTMPGHEDDIGSSPGGFDQDDLADYAGASTPAGGSALSPSGLGQPGKHLKSSSWAGLPPRSQPPSEAQAPASSASQAQAQNHTQQLLRIIHMRLEQKFKDYRKAFRHFDVNFDGSVEFHEFVQGLELCGINMPYHDYKLVFDAINWDNAKEIDFSKFCLINTDKSNNIQQLIKSKKEH